MTLSALKQRYNARANDITKDYVLASAGAGFIPLPLIDLLLISSIQLKMIHALSRLYGVPFSKHLAKRLIVALAGGGVALYATRFPASLLKAIPVVGTIAGAISVAALGAASTYAIGQIFKRHFSRGGTLQDLDPEAMQAAYQAKLRQGGKITKKLKPQKGKKRDKKSTQTTTDSGKKPFYKRWWRKKHSQQSAPIVNQDATPATHNETTLTQSSQPIDEPTTSSAEPHIQPSSSSSPPPPPLLTVPSSQRLDIEPHKHHSRLGFPIFTLLIVTSAILVFLALGTLVLHDRIIAPHYPNLHEYIHTHILPAEHTIYVAAISPMTGNNAINGEEMRKGVQLRIDEINKKGGIHGKYVKLLHYYDENLPEKAADIAREVAKNEKVLAVIGHYTSPTSLAASTVYQVHGIPAITGTATVDELTQNNEWYFRIIFNNKLQASLAANYLYKVLEQHQVEVIYNHDAYGKSLAQHFVNTAKAIGLKVNAEWETDASSESIKQVVSHLTQILESADNEDRHGIFLATHASEAASIIKALHPFKDRLVFLGGDAVASIGFEQAMQQYPQEKTMPGYYSDNVYTISPFLNGLASRHAQSFRLNFWSHYQAEPSLGSAMYYDAATVILQAIENTQPWQASGIQAQRAAVKEGLWEFADVETAVEGVTGYNYFNTNGDVVKTIPIGVYRKGRLMTALEQFQPFSGLEDSNSLDLFEAALDNQVISLDGYLMRRARIVYTGMHFNEIEVLDSRHDAFNADFYLWFRFQDKAFSDTNLNFSTLYAFIEPLGTPIIDQTTTTERDAIVRTYRVKGTFKYTPNYQQYPLDTQVLPINFHHRELTRDRLIYVIDAIGMGLGDRNGSAMINHLRRHQLFTTNDWTLSKGFFFQNLRIYDTSLGLPARFLNERPLEYSQFNAVIEIKRQFHSVMIKHLLPAGLMVLLGYLTFFLPMTSLPMRILLGVGILLMTAIFHLQMNLGIPNVSYPVFLEYMYYLGYILAIFVILMAAIINHKYKHGHAKNICDVRRLNMLGKLLYPVIILVWMAIVLE